ncbi:MAG: hypothetical protein ABIL09_15990 [Gemmatimonadota bacterium]
MRGLAGCRRTMARALAIGLVAGASLAAADPLPSAGPGPATPPGADLLQVRGAVHVHTSFSTGLEGLEQVAERAVEQGIGVLVLADDDLLRIEYGVPFLRNLVRFGHSEDAVIDRLGLERYLEEIRRIDAAHEDLIVIDGVESAPFYYWTRDPDGTWVVRHWNKHLMAVDLRTAEAYAGLPVLGGRAIWSWRWSSLLLLWPAIGLLYAFWMGRRVHGWWLRGPVAAVCILSLADSAAVGFKVPEMDAYHGDLGAAPYQRFINYVAGRGGIAIWAHPEARSTIAPRSLLGGAVRVVSRTGAHAEDLVETRDYHAFAALYGDNTTATDPGQQWDQVLVEHLRGERASAPWGTGEIDYHEDEPGGRLQDISTVFLMRQRTRAEALQALREGRVYAVRGGEQALRLQAFAVSTEAGAAVSGERVPAFGQARVFAALERWDGAAGEEARLRLVRGDASGARVVAEITGAVPLELNRIDTDVDAERPVYYRVLASSRGSRLTSNPIFVGGR